MFFTLSVADADEMAAVTRPVTADGVIKDHLELWRCYAIRRADGGCLGVFLSGIGQVRGRQLGTSDLVELDLDRGLARTVNGSLYGLGERDSGDPAPALLAALARFVAGEAKK